MSMFLPDGFDPTGGAGGSSSPTDFGSADPQSSTDDVALMQRVLAAAAHNPSLIPESFMGYVLDWLQINKLQIPLTQVFGYEKFVATQVSLYQDNGQSLSGTFASGANASGAGPSVAAVAGKYVVLAGADMSTQFGNGVATLTVSPGGMVVRGSAASVASVAKGTSMTLAVDGTISSTLFVAGDGSSTNVTSTISGAWMIAIRYAS